MYRAIKTLSTRHIQRREIEFETISVFGEGSRSHLKIMDVCDKTAQTHKEQNKKGKKRKNGDRLIDHERFIFLVLIKYLGIKDVDVLIAAFLHDMYEDYPNVWSLKHIKACYGSRVATLVRAITNPHLKPGEDKMCLAYTQRLVRRLSNAEDVVWVIKIIDRLHNMLTMYGERPQVLWKIRQTVHFVQPKSIKFNVLPVVLHTATNSQMRRYNVKDHELAWPEAA